MQTYIHSIKTLLNKQSCVSYKNKWYELFKMPSTNPILSEVAELLSERNEAVINKQCASKCPYKRKATLEGVDNFWGTELKEDSIIQKATVGTPSKQLCEVYNKSDNLHVNSIVWQCLL